MCTRLRNPTAKKIFRWEEFHCNSFTTVSHNWKAVEYFHSFRLYLKRFIHEYSSSCYQNFINYSVFLQLRTRTALSSLSQPLQAAAVVESPSLQVLKNHVALETWVSGGLGSAGLMVGLDDLRGPFQGKSFHDFKFLPCKSAQN